MEQARMKYNPWIVFAYFTAHFFFNFSYKYLDWAARARHVNIWVPFIEELTGHYGAMLLCPLVLLLVRRWPVDKSHLARIATVYAPSLLIFSAIHTTLNAVSRDVIFPLVGLGPYDYGILPIRYAMEFPEDVMSFFAIVAVIHILDFYAASRQRDVIASQLESQLAQAQLENLRLQLQPHFLFNALNTISQVMYEDPGAADVMIARLSEFLRMTLNTTPAQEVKLEEELKFLELYVNIMRARFEEKLLVRMNVPDEFSDAMVPQLLLQPLVENAIRHGAGPGGVVEVAVSAARHNGTLSLEVRDRGAGCSASPGQGIGLANTRGRLRKLYGSEQRFESGNAPDGGFRVSVDIPYHS